MNYDSDLSSAIANNSAPFAFADVEAIEASWDNSDVKDEPDYVWLLRLKDGQWAAASGSHDYTGWDCVSSFSATLHPTREEAIRLGLTVNDRENLGLLLPGESMTEAKP